MTGRSSAPFPRAPWDRVIAWIAAAGVLAFVAFAAVTIVPAALAARDSRVADGVQARAIGDVEVVVPEGWVVMGASDELVVRTPDGALTVRIDPASGAASTALQDALTAEVGAVPTATVGPFRTEMLASGLRVVHADVGAYALYAVVGSGEDAALLLGARAAEDRALEDYRAAIGLLLEAVRP